MAQCKLCNKKGFFVSVSGGGLCAECRPAVGLDVEQRSRIIGESDEIVGKSTNWKTRLSRADLVLEHTTHLWEKYEKRGIPTFDPPPSEIRSTYLKARGDIILETARDETDKALAKAELAATATTKNNAANKAILILGDLRKELGSESTEIDEMEARVREFVHRTQLDHFLEAARKAEFKGNAKKALDQYQEALYFLKTDDIDDVDQVDIIAKIEAKVAELS